MINLSLGLCYVHYALKRQADNRQHLIMQGFTFLFTYYDSRKQSSRPAERQEADYNIARTYHLLGLTHLALPYYSSVLQASDEGQIPVAEDLAVEAAYNMQTLYAMSGNMMLSRAITEKYLAL